MDSKYYLVVGLGKTGYSIARYLKRQKLKFCMFDTRTDNIDLPSFSQEFADVKLYLGNIPENVYQDIQEIIASPA